MVPCYIPECTLQNACSFCPVQQLVVVGWAAQSRGGEGVSVALKAGSNKETSETGTQETVKDAAHDSAPQTSRPSTELKGMGGARTSSHPESGREREPTTFGLDVL